MNVEHVYIGDEVDHHSTDPAKIYRQDTIDNLVNGSVTEITYYSEGFIKVRKIQKGKNCNDSMLELRFLDKDPIVTRHSPSTFLWLFLSFGLLAAASAVLMPLADLSQYSISTVTICATISVVSLLYFVYRGEVRYRFRTACGQANVLILTSSFGCHRRMRATVNRVMRAIADAIDKIDTFDKDYLRAEIQAHYRLANTGVITRKACTDGNFLILARLG